MEDSSRSVKETKQLVRGQDTTGRSLVNEYAIIRSLGEGAFGKVKLCQHQQTGQYHAIKIFKKSLLRKKREFQRTSEGVKVSDALSKVVREIAIMKKLDHPNVVRLHEVINDEESDKLYMILDYVERGQMMEWDPESKSYFSCQPDIPRGPLRLEVAQAYFRDIVRGLDYLHRNGIVHRDLKPENLLVDACGRVKIADFGVAAVFEDEEMLKKTEGTYHFLAPECCSGSHAAGPAADVWALGVTLWVFLFGTLPFWGENVKELFDAISEKEIDIPTSLPPVVRELLRALLQKDPAQRITVTALMEHPWVQENAPPTPTQQLAVLSVTEDDLSAAISQPRTFALVKKLSAKWLAQSRESLANRREGSENGNGEH